jgi:hypothetical protein
MDMKKLLPVLLLVALAAFLASCMEPEPAEISVICKLSGSPRGCTAQLFNTKGNQIAEISTDYGGIGYFKNVTAATYTIKFVDAQGNYYAAEKTVTVTGGESLPVQVELSEPPAPDPGS